MPTTPATWNTTDGSWFVAANWDEPNPSAPPPLVHHVPGASEDVSIPNNSGASTPFTVTYNGTDTVNTLAGDVTGTLDITGGSLTLLNGGASNSMAIDVGTGATLSVAAGTLNITAGTYAGTLAGNGTIQFRYGSFDLEAGVSVTVADWVLGVTGNGTVSHTTLDTDLTYAGNFTLADLSGNHAVLELNSHTLTLSGAATFDGTIHGPGTVLVTGSSVQGSGGFGAPVLYGGAVLEYAAGSTAVQHLNTGLGDQPSLTTGTVKIDAGATYTIDQSASLGSSAATYAIVNNAGTLKVGGAAGTSATLNAQFTNTGTLTVDSGNTLTLGLGALGVVNTLGGSIGGAGTLVLGGTTTLTTSTVTVGALALNGGNGGASLTLGTDLTYAGAFSFANQFDTLDLNGHTFTLSGASSSLMGNVIDGAGALKVTGTVSIGGNINVGGPNGAGTPATVENAGTMTQSGSVGLNGTLLIDAGHGYTITTAGNITSLGASGATVTNKGTFTDSAAGTSTIGGTFTNTGSLVVGSGATLVLSSGAETVGKVSGAGTLVFGFASNATINSTAVTVGALAFSGGNGGALATLGVNLTYAGSFNFAGQFDTMALNGHGLTLTGSTAFTGGTFTGKAGAVDILTVNGASTDLSSVHFSSWEATDRVALNGTGGNDTLTGSSVADTINGGAGADTMAGGLGNDVYYVDDAGDQVLEAAGHGSDTVYASVSWSMAAGQEIEFLRAYGAGATSGVALTGNEFANTLVGGSGNDTLTGGGGADTMSGGAGDDTYYVDNAGDKVIEAAGGGSDTVYASVNWSMAAGQAIEFLRAYGVGATAGVALTGNELANSLIGGTGNDQLNGGGGADTMSGGAGDDKYFVDNAGDQVLEAAGGGTDTVYASVNWSMAAGQEIEYLRAYGAGATSGVTLTGNELANNLVGGSGNDTLNGGGGNDTLTGGAGADTMSGGAGDDKYYVDNAGDKVLEAAGGGSDTVYASVNWTMAAGQEIEFLRAYGAAATSGVALTGNELANSLFGGTGNDQLIGGGGADTMSGGAGDDKYFVDNAGDQVLEAAGGGNDTVYASTSWSMGSGQEIESLRAYGAGATAGVTLTGNEFANSVVGGTGNDVLNGGGGNDVLVGGGGQDTFLFDTALTGNVDRITDFSATETIELDKTTFTALTALGTLSASAFFTGAAAHDADDRIIYNQATGNLFYDSDGTGAAAAVQFAHLDGMPALSNTNFTVVA